MVIWHKGGHCVEVFKKLRQYYWPYKNYFIFSMVFLLIVTGLTVVYPVILQQTIAKVIYKGQYDLIPTLTLGFLGIMVINGIATYIQQYTGDLFGIKSVYRMRNALYEKLQFLPFSYYDNAKTGDLMSRLTADVETFRFFLSMGFSELFRFILMLSVAFGVMFRSQHISSNIPVIYLELNLCIECGTHYMKNYSFCHLVIMITQKQGI